ncbi:MAG: flavodoxin family protein, partial [Deltaproteobacteria bacterium]|nr:flavodoxin family protein [Deltaproteobacteria bacterium]
VGISSSPIKGGNVDRMIQYILDKSGKPSRFINLADLVFSPCRACAHLCAKDNICGLEDDLKPLYPQLIEAEALVLGTPSYFNNMNGFMSIFLERLWAFRHQRFPLKGKPFFVIASGGVESPEMAIEAVKRRMLAYRAVFSGQVAYSSKIIPCLTCGYGTVCEVGASQYAYGKEKRKNLQITPELFNKWEDSAGIREDIEETALKIKNL